MKDLGIVVPIVTPCTRAGEVDPVGLKAVCRDMLNSGCHSIFVAGSTGRGPWFSRAERARLCRAAAEEMGGEGLLMAGCIALGLAGMLENARAMADAGAQVAVITAPGYFSYNQAEVTEIFLRFADFSPLPVMLYDIPGFARMKLDNEVILRLARHGNVIGFKDSTGDFDRFKGLLKGLEDAPDFYLLQGKERILADSLRLGASGFVISMVHIDPRPFVALYQAVRAGDLKKASRIQAEVKKLMDLFETSMQRRQETSTFFHFLNWTVRYRGLCNNVLLAHEGECPDWMEEFGLQAMEICRQAAEI